MVLVALYLLAVVLANLSATYFGPAATIVNAFLFIGLDLSTRDELHERWKGPRLWANMFALILAGSFISYLLNRNALPIAKASAISFLAAGLVDAFVYALLRKFPKLTKMNGSNVVSAAVDSVVFPTVAFGSFMPLIALGQFAAKVIGGGIWSLILARGRK